VGRFVGRGGMGWWRPHGAESEHRQKFRGGCSVGGTAQRPGGHARWLGDEVGFYLLRKTKKNASAHGLLRMRSSPRAGAASAALGAGAGVAWSRISVRARSGKARPTVHGAGGARFVVGPACYHCSVRMMPQRAAQKPQSAAFRSFEPGGLSRASAVRRFFFFFGTVIRRMGPARAGPSGPGAFSRCSFVDPVPGGGTWAGRARKKQVSRSGFESGFDDILPLPRDPSWGRT